MLLYLIITCFSLILFLNCLALKPLPPWARPTELRLLSLCFWKEISFFSIPSSVKNSLNITTIIIPSPKLSFKHMMSTSNDRVEEVSGGAEMSVLDLPELVLECILEKLPPSGLCNMAAVCSSLRDRCMSDHLWEKQMKQKWGRIVGPAAYREWQWHLASRKDSTHLKQGKQRLWMKLFSFVRSFSWVRSKVHDTSKQTTTTRLPVDSNSIMSWYLALETGRFWFPAQVYNREVYTYTLMHAKTSIQLSFLSNKFVFVVFCRMVMLALFSRAMMQSLAMIRVPTPSKPGNLREIGLFTL